MSTLHTESVFEDELVGHLVAHGGWLSGDSSNYDRKLALYPEDVIGWIKDTQPLEYDKVNSAQNGSTDAIILDRLVKEIQEEGALAALRHGFKRVNARFSMLSFKPGHRLNPETLEKYGKVRCRVVRQLHYSSSNANSIDVVLFVNGIALVTLELKTDFTQNIEDAIVQYKNDRLPKDSSGKPEPLLTFKRGAVVHFAVSTDEVRMTTRLEGTNTQFLPFNLGNDGGAGNPPNPDGYNTAYLYQDVLQRDSFLEILEKYVHLEKSVREEDGKKIVVEQMIFPRYHQRDAIQKLVAAAKVEGPGKNYLVQHSAGSGKSNTIKWLAHQVSSLHDATDTRVFDSVIVITDRTILDDQLKDAIMQFEHQAGWVVSISDKNGSKSGKLFNELEKKTAIIIVTIQTFPYALKAMSQLKGLKKRNFAIIADEAHSSQTGEAAKSIREGLGYSDDATTDTDGDFGAQPEMTPEEALLATMAKRADSKNISYFAFTATPKPKTMERFGRVGASGKPEPFHVYTMQQAIEEQFILDVLQRYTTYDVAYKLATIDDKTGERIVPKSDAARLIAKAAKLHSYAIEQKVAIIVEHYRENIKPLLGGRAKAMVVCDGRKAAVRYKLAIDTYIDGKGYDIKTLVAFSGKVTDDSNGIPDEYSEDTMNDLVNEEIPEAFNTGRYQVLLVADKYQTGFNQPLLVAMYVDKKLANIAAVQTLSRLNRTFSQGNIKKTDTYILDFANEGADILKAFLPYYKRATMVGVTDPDTVHDLQKTLDKAGIYTDVDVQAFFEAFTKAQGLERGAKRQALLMAVLNPIVSRFQSLVKKAITENDQVQKRALEIFRENVTNFVRTYGFLSQIYNYSDTDLEKRYIMCSFLGRLLKDNQDVLPVDVSGIDMTHFGAEKIFEGDLGLSKGMEVALKPQSGVGTAKPHAPKFGPLEEVIKAMNQVFGGSLTDDDKIKVGNTMFKLAADNETLKEHMLNNSFEQVMSAGETKEFGDRLVVETRETIIEENERQSVAVGEGLNELLNDEEGLQSIVKAVLASVYKLHHDEQAK